MRIIKMSYSSNPWRLIDSAGREIGAPPKRMEDGAGREMRIMQTIMGDTKTECIENALSLLEAFLDMEEEVCGWQDEGGYHSNCGQDFTFNESGPIENGFIFCPYCRKRIVSYDDKKELEKYKKMVLMK